MPIEPGFRLSKAQLVELSSGIVERIAPTPTVLTAAWVSGSLVEDLGNVSSDIDIFVAVPEVSSNLPTTRRDRDHAIYATVEHGRRFDVEYWSEDRIEGLATRLAAAPVDDAKRSTLHYFEYWESEFIHRILIGLPVVKPEAFLRLRASFDARLFQRYLATNAIHRVDDAFDDSVGMLENGDLDCAVLRARDTVELSIDALLYINGVTNDKTKFRLTKLKRLIAKRPEMHRDLERLWRFEALPPGEVARHAYVEDALRYSSELVDRVQSELVKG